MQDDWLDDIGYQSDWAEYSDAAYGESLALENPPGLNDISVDAWLVESSEQLEHPDLEANLRFAGIQPQTVTPTEVSMPFYHFVDVIDEYGFAEAGGDGFLADDFFSTQSAWMGSVHPVQMPLADLPLNDLTTIPLDPLLVDPWDTYNDPGGSYGETENVLHSGFYEAQPLGDGPSSSNEGIGEDVLGHGPSVSLDGFLDSRTEFIGASAENSSSRDTFLEDTFVLEVLLPIVVNPLGPSFLAEREGFTQLDLAPVQTPIMVALDVDDQIRARIGTQGASYSPSDPLLRFESSLLSTAPPSDAFLSIVTPQANSPLAPAHGHNRTFEQLDRSSSREPATALPATVLPATEAESTGMTDGLRALGLDVLRERNDHGSRSGARIDRLPPLATENVVGEPSASERTYADSISMNTRFQTPIAENLQSTDNSGLNQLYVGGPIERLLEIESFDIFRDLIVETNSLSSTTESTAAIPVTDWSAQSLSIACLAIGFGILSSSVYVNVLRISTRKNGSKPRPRLMWEYVATWAVEEPLDETRPAIARICT